MRIDRTRERENEKEKKKKQQSILEKEIFSIMEKSMEAALDKAVDDLLKDWNKEIKIKLSDNLVGGVIGKDRNIDLYNKARRFEKDRICCIIPVTEGGWEDYVACDQFITKLVPNNVVPLIEPSKDPSHKAEWGVNSNGIHYMES